MNLIGYCPKCTIDTEVTDYKCSMCHTDININDIIDLNFDNYNYIALNNKSFSSISYIDTNINNSIDSSIVYFVDYVYLDADEREKFSNVSFEYITDEPILKQLEIEKQPLFKFEYQYCDDIYGCDICFDEENQTIKTSCGCTMKYCYSCIKTMDNICCVCKNKLFIK
ncbi:MAG: hypothetical protein Terrestrivirus6_52 [Terrestrivirus sp.]|uniref:RING-type domain-containing protein n=1 Tax=Terrestrivirus sp. TaxID=2487775 RepID=A0A3G4ZNH3_9VIRU|nr:MAG: hypothetical protein Terrestrivirus6_52 [Terrestrivirus sp.]